MREFKGKNIIDFPLDFTIIDVGTTGYDPEWDELIEIGALRVRDGKVIDEYITLIKPNNKIDDFVINKTGITNEMLKDAPMPNTVLKNFYEFIGQDILVGHNINFHINFIYDYLLETNNLYLSNNFIDVMRISRFLFQDFENHRLLTLCNNFNTDHKPNHRSTDDCYSVFEVFNCLKTYIKKNNIDYLKFGKKKKSSPGLKAKDIIATKTDFDMNHPLYQKVVAFTGALSIPRKDAMLLVKNVGGDCSDGVTKNINYLVLGNLDYSANIKGDKSSKLIKAEKYILEGLDIEILSEKIFFDMINDYDNE